MHLSFLIRIGGSASTILGKQDFQDPIAYINIMKERLNKYRSNFRREQIEQYMKQRRDHMIKIEQEQHLTQQVNSKTIEFVQKKSIDQLYQMFTSVTSNSHSPVEYLTNSTTLTLFRFLGSNLASYQHLYLLGRLINSKYNVIFLNPEHQGLCMEFIGYLYQTTSAIVSEHKRSKNQEKTINFLLKIIQVLLYLKDQKESQEKAYSFRGIIEPHFLANHLYVWCQVLHSFPLYMLVLALTCQDPEVKQEHSFKHTLRQHPGILMPIIEQMNPYQKGCKVACGIPSVIVANYLMRDIDNNKLVAMCLPGYLQEVKAVYKLSQEGANRLYQKFTCLQSLNTVLTVFQRLQNELLQVNLGQILSRSNFWALCHNILRTQTYQMREKALGVIVSACKNMLICGGKMQEYVGETTIGILVQELETNNKAIQKKACESLFLLMSYYEKHYKNDIGFLRWMNQYEVNAVLDDLVYDHDVDLKAMAIKLQQLKASFDKDEDRSMMM